MKSMMRIRAVASKEWQLNLRFPVQYFVGNFMSPIKSSVLMLLIYRGFLSNSGSTFGIVQADNYKVFVLVGTTCHALFTNCLGVFSDKFTTEKYWQTFVATLISPASALEVILGYIAGSGSIHIAIAASVLAISTVFFSIPLSSLIIGCFVLLLIAATGFGIGLVGGTIRLCFEGWAYLFDYAMQAIVFMSCFYYPLEMIPTPFRWIPQLLPTYHMADLLHRLYLEGFRPSMIAELGMLTACSLLLLCLPALLLDRSVRKFGIVGY